MSIIKEMIIESQETVSDLKILCWNVAGIKNKSAEVWNKIKQADVCCLLETWLPSEQSDDWKSKLDDEMFVWYFKPAVKKHSRSRGRAKVGMAIGIKRKIEHLIKPTAQDERWIMNCEIGIKDMTILITFLYNDDKFVQTRSRLDEICDECKKDQKAWILMGDFNARIGEDSPSETSFCRATRSKDKIVNSNGRMLLTWTEIKGLKILNGCTPSDQEGEWTFVRGGKGTSVIDFGMINTVAESIVKDFEVCNINESDHRPIMVTVGGLETGSILE